MFVDARSTDHSRAREDDLGIDEAEGEWSGENERLLDDVVNTT